MSTSDEMSGLSRLEKVENRGLGLTTFVSAGNRADVSGNDLLQYWEEDEATEVILLYLESIGNPRKFSRIARRVSRRKPIIAVRSGRSSQGVRMGHAVRKIAAPPEAVDAMFRQAGILQVESLEEMFPGPLLTTILARYPNARELFWVQEEPKNMGCWTFVRPLLEDLLVELNPQEGGPRFAAPRYVGRVASASPATGSPDSHALERKLILEEAFANLA